MASTLHSGIHSQQNYLPLHAYLLPGMLWAGKEHYLTGRRTHLTSQAGVKLNSWRIVKSSHKAVSHTPITPAQQGHPLITNSKGPSLHTSLIFRTTRSSKHCSGGKAQGQSFGCLSIVFWVFFLLQGKDFISFKLVICFSQAKDCSAGMRRLKVTTGTFSLLY